MPCQCGHVETYEFSADVLRRWAIGRGAKDLAHPSAGMPVGGKACVIISCGQRCVALLVLLASSTAVLPLLLQLKRVVFLSVSRTIGTARMR